MLVLHICMSEVTRIEQASRRQQKERSVWKAPGDTNRRAIATCYKEDKAAGLGKQHPHSMQANKQPDTHVSEEYHTLVRLPMLGAAGSTPWQCFGYEHTTTHHTDCTERPSVLRHSLCCGTKTCNFGGDAAQLQHTCSHNNLPLLPATNTVFRV